MGETLFLYGFGHQCVVLKTMNGIPGDFGMAWVAFNIF